MSVAGQVTTKNNRGGQAGLVPHPRHSALPSLPTSAHSTLSADRWSGIVSFIHRDLIAPLSLAQPCRLSSGTKLCSSSLLFARDQISSYDFHTASSVIQRRSGSVFLFIFPLLILSSSAVHATLSVFPIFGYLFCRCC